MPIDFLQDFALLSILLFAGFVLRNQIKLIQKLFIPVSIIAGLLALGFGQEGANLIPFTSSIQSYPGILIAILFGALPFTYKIEKNRSLKFKTNAAQMGGMTLIILLLQWGGGLLFGLTILTWLFPDLNQGFGAMIATGFFGGHGTAAAISASFTEQLQWDEASSLAMTSATVGIFAATIGGIVWVQWGIKNKATAFLTSYNQLPEYYKTGLIKKENRTSIGDATFSNIAIDPLLVHIALAILVGCTGLFLSQLTKDLTNGFSIAGFSYAFIVGIVFKWLITRIKVIDYFDTKIMSRICGSLADLIVAFGIATIQIAVVIKYAIPLILLFLFGIILSIVIFKKLGPSIFEDNWFEKSMFLWGLSLGVTALGIALLRMVDTEGHSKTLPAFAIGYIFVTPFEVGILAFFPLLVSIGMTWPFTLISLLLALGLWLYLYKRNTSLQ